MKSDLCTKCVDHSGIVKSIEVLEADDAELKCLFNKMNTKITATLITVTITSLTLLVHFVIKHYDTASAIAQEIVSK